jgi:hypothetical protein
MRGVFISAAVAALIPLAAVAEPAASTVFMNARIVAASPDGRSLTVVGTDGHSRTLAIDSRSSVRPAGLRMGDEVIVTARGLEDVLVVTGVRVVETVPATAATAPVATAPGSTAPAAFSAADYFAARRQRPNPYSLINPMFPRDSPKNPWSRRRLVTGDER